ncbi:MAG TPA: ABC transporter permease subunit [Candidatus Saccharimonadales bacterium]
MIPSILRELRDRRVSTIAYCVVAAGTLLMYMGLYPSIHDSAEKFQAIYSSYPQEFYQALGIQNFSLGTLEGYLAIEYFSIVWLLLAAFFAASKAGMALAGEVEKGMMNFYLMLPIGRGKLYIAKYLSFLVTLVLFMLSSVLVIFPLAGMYKINILTGRMWQVALVSLLFAWAIYAVSLCLSALFSERSKVYMIVGGTLLIQYIMFVVGGLKKDWDWLYDYTIFHYYNAQSILNGSSPEWQGITLFAVLIVAFSVLGYIIFRRRDIATA